MLKILIHESIKNILASLDRSVALAVHTKCSGFNQLDLNRLPSDFRRVASVEQNSFELRVPLFRQQCLAVFATSHSAEMLVFYGTIVSASSFSISEQMLFAAQNAFQDMLDKQKSFLFIL